MLELCALLACAVALPGHSCSSAQALRDGHVAAPAGQKQGVTQLGAASFDKPGCKNLIGIKNTLICAQNLTCS